ncbi:MAG TPA: M1 family metallopeptidase, partial [Chitinophagaceae bacterium]
MKRISILFLAFVFCLSTASAQQYWQQRVDYTINVTLNDSAKTLDGFEKILYVNNSPDTLRFIWFHLWPNAYKNDKTAFSEQVTADGNTGFYFSDESERGYINRLAFKVNDITASVEEHPVYIDITKLNLPAPLPPGRSVTITTPFHVKLPKNISRGGYAGETFQATQWYPKPAVYDRKGWHRMPYLDQGEFYSEFGKFDVTITVPQNFIVAATGVLQNADELAMLQRTGRQPLTEQENYKTWKLNFDGKARKTGKTYYELMPPSAPQTKTLRYVQDSVHDFAWFASKLFVVQYDTLRSGSRVTDVFTFFHPWEAEQWKESLSYAKEGTGKYSQWLGAYPFRTVSVVSGEANEASGGMEYPTITLITTKAGGQELDVTITHEIGHNWFYGILASNERDHAWMDEGMNTYYQNRYELEKYGSYHLLGKTDAGFFSNKTPDDAMELMLNLMFRMYKDQPIDLPSDQYSMVNYGLIVYLKASIWMKKLEEQLGRPLFDSTMQHYYREWAFRHPYPEDFRASVEKYSGADIDTLYKQLFITGPLSAPEKKNLKLTGFFNLKHTNRFNYISILPAAGYNFYDKFMVGGLIHNYSLPLPAFRFAIAPLYGTNSGKLNAIGQVSIHHYSAGKISEISAGISGARFSTSAATDSSGQKVFGGFSKLAPSLKVRLNNSNPRSALNRWFDLRSYLIWETGLNYIFRQSDQTIHAEEGTTKFFHVNQLSYNAENNRALYPYRYQLQVQQGKEFYRASATLNYFFNYRKAGGLALRLAAVKFGYIGGKTPMKELNTLRYQPKLTAVRGNEDYTYSNYFIGRQEFEGLASQQIMERDGNLKIRTDIFQDLQGRSDDWIAAINLCTTIPENLLPVPLPVKVFADAGTHAAAWKKDTELSRFLYVAGLQISLLGDLVNIYAPIIYSKEFSNSLKTVPEENKFFRKVSFSINLQNLNAR